MSRDQNIFDTAHTLSIYVCDHAEQGYCPDCAYDEIATCVSSAVAAAEQRAVRAEAKLRAAEKVVEGAKCIVAEVQDYMRETGECLPRDVDLAYLSLDDDIADYDPAWRKP